MLGNEGRVGRVKEMMKGDREVVKRKKKVKEASKESINQTIGGGLTENWEEKCTFCKGRKKSQNNGGKKRVKKGDESNHRRASENMRARQLSEVSISHISDHLFCILFLDNYQKLGTSSEKKRLFLGLRGPLGIPLSVRPYALKIWINCTAQYINCMIF